MKRTTKYNVIGMNRLIRAIYGRQGGADGITLKTVIKHDPQTLLRCSQPILSLDYIIKTDSGEAVPFGERIDIESIVLPKRKNLIEKVSENEILELTKQVRQKILETWRIIYSSGRDGTKLAVNIFDGLCDGETLSEIARNLNVTRERIRQVQEQLKKFPAVIRMGRILRATKSDKDR